jgi:hypothetical protein
MRKIKTAHIPQLDPFELRPDALVRVKFGGTGWEAFQMQPLRRAIREEFLNQMTAVNGGAIPNDEYSTRHLAQQVFEKCHDVCRIQRAVLAMEVQLAFG